MKKGEAFGLTPLVADEYLTRLTVTPFIVLRYGVTTNAVVANTTCVVGDTRVHPTTWYSDFHQ
jgi:hypothetical protein